MRKIFAIIISGIMLLSLVACGSSEGSGEGKYVVGISQFVQHAALDAASQGFMDALKEKLGDSVEFDLQNAQGETANCATIVNGFVSSNVDLILANATPALQAAAAGTGTIPILGTSITNYPIALDIEDQDGATGINVSGTSDLAPLDQQATMLKELFPEAETVGILYCSAEANSLYQVEVMTKELETLGYTVEKFSFVDSNDIASITNNAVSKSDVIYVPTDNTAAANTEVINNICLPAKVPVFAGEEGTCKGCGVATLSINYYDLGYKTGEMAYEVLVNEKDVSTMKIEYSPILTKKYNPVICQELGITVTDDYEAVSE